MRIGVVYQPGEANAGYRAIAPAGALDERGHHVTLVAQRDDCSFDAQPLTLCDVVHVYRRADPAIRRCMERLQQRGIAVTWDNDDDIRLAPEHRLRELGVSKLDVQQDFRAQTKALRRADVVTTTTEHLAATYRSAGADHVMVIPNHLNALQYAERLSSRGTTTIGWVAASEHQTDARTLGVSQVLRRVIERHPTVRVVTVGVRLDLPSDRYEHHKYIPFVELRDVVRRFDIGIAPIADVPMNHARSDVKVKEYAAAGVPWLASARGPYVGLGEKQGGLLVEDGGWEDALDRLVTGRFLRRRLHRRAAAWAKTQAIERHVATWLSAFERAVEVRAERAGRDGRPSASLAGRRS